jgi:predicted enzyme related to lactoylglutathione lyase
MGRVTGIGGAFLRVKDPKALYAWYEKHLGLQRSNGCFEFDPSQQQGSSVVSFFAKDSDYYPVSQPAMLNLKVDDLDAVLDALIAAGVEVDAKRDRYDFGNFGWFVDPEGNRVELWQPK